MQGCLDLVEARGMRPVEEARHLRGLPAEPFRELALVEPGAHRAVCFEFGRGQGRQSHDRASLRRGGTGHVLVVRHPPEDHLIEQTVGLGERLVAGLSLAPAVRQVGGS